MDSLIRMSITTYGLSFICKGKKNTFNPQRKAITRLQEKNEKPRDAWSGFTSPLKSALVFAQDSEIAIMTTPSCLPYLLLLALSARCLFLFVLAALASVLASAVLAFIPAKVIHC